MKSITFRTQFIMNAMTIVIVGLIVFVSTTFASTPQPNGATGAANQPTVSLNQQTASDYTTISYQGHLTDADGKPVTAEQLWMTFRLYTASEKGSPIWEEKRSGSNGVPVKEGLFNVMLGSVTPLSTDVLTRELWLGISVAGDSEMTPRERLNRMPALIPDGSVTSDKLALQHGTVCLQERVNMKLPGDWKAQDIPGLSLGFTLDKPSAVLVWMEGGAQFSPDQAGDANDDILLSLLLDDDEGHAGNRADAGSYNLDGQSLVMVDSGTHTLKAIATSATSGSLMVLERQKTAKGMGLRTCINYLVLGQQ